MQSTPKARFRSVLVGAGLLTLTSASRSADASTSWESPYSLDQTFSCALRLLRVDLALPITERDTEGGFVLFEYVSSESANKATRGSLEFVRSRLGTHVTVQLPSMPAYHEAAVLEKLGSKLRQEQGEPPPRPMPQPTPAPTP